MDRCRAIKANGERCKISVDSGVELCWAHDPGNAPARKRITSKAGRSRPNKEVQDLRERLEDLYSSVLTGLVEAKTGAVLAQIANTQIRLVETELRVREQVELEERIDELERLLEGSGEKGSAWG